MNLVSLILLAGALAALAAGAYCWTVALTEARPYFPLEFRDGLSSRYALDTMIWNRSVPVNARRKYLWSPCFLTIAMGCFMLSVAARGPAFGAVLFGGVFAIGVVITTKRWLAHRHEL
jgi:hypothetical protein